MKGYIQIKNRLNTGLGVYQLDKKTGDVINVFVSVVCFGEYKKDSPIAQVFTNKDYGLFSGYYIPDVAKKIRDIDPTFNDPFQKNINAGVVTPLGVKLLSFIIPLIGLILYFVYKKDWY